MGRRYRTLVIVLFFSLGAACFAQEAETTEFEFKVFGVGSDHYEGLYYYTGEVFELLEFHRTHRSVRTYQYKGPLAFSIYVKNPDYVVTDPASLPYIKISESFPTTRAKRQLIVFAASPLNRESSETERKFTLYHIDDSPQAFRRNTIIVINTTRAELFGSVADAKISLPTGHTDPIPYSSGNSVSAATNISFALETKSGAKLVMSNDLKIPNNRRVILILEPPRRPGSLRISVRMLSESIFLEEEDAIPN